MTAQKSCEHCNAELTAESNYCSSCGTQVEGSTERLELEKFFNYALDMLCIADTQGFFRRVNPAFNRTLGYSPTELLGRPFVDFIHPDDRGGTLAEIGKLKTGQPTLSFENRYRCKDGSYRDLAWTSFPEPKTGLLYAVARDITEQKRRESRQDRLTGAVTRRVFDEVLVEEWSRTRRLGVSLALALVDIDRFKAYNAQYGFKAGDDRLRHLGTLLAEHARRTGDIVARYDGQQFAIIWSGGVTLKDAASLCERIRSAVEYLDIPHDGADGGRFTVSVGTAAMVPTSGSSADQLLRAAQSALDRAKDQGRNRVVESED